MDQGQSIRCLRLSRDAELNGFPDRKRHLSEHRMEPMGLPLLPFGMGRDLHSNSRRRHAFMCMGNRCESNHGMGCDSTTRCRRIRGSCPNARRFRFARDGHHNAIHHPPVSIHRRIGALCSDSRVKHISSSTGSRHPE